MAWLLAAAAFVLGGSPCAVADDPNPVNAGKEPVQIVEGPQVETTTDARAIIRWTLPRPAARPCDMGWCITVPTRMPFIRRQNP